MFGKKRLLCFGMAALFLAAFSFPGMAKEKKDGSQDSWRLTLPGGEVHFVL